MGLIDIVWHGWLKQPYRLNVAADQGDPRAKETIILLHGIASDGSIWRPLLRQLGSDCGYRVIVPDLLGFGASPRPGRLPYDVKDHAAAVLSTIQAKVGKGKVTLVAHSMGCLVAAHIAAEQPRLVKRLILFEPPLFAADPAYRSHARRAARYLAFYNYLANHPELLMLQHRRMYRIAQKISGLVLNPETWLPFERSLKNTILKQQAFQELRTIKISTDIVYGRLDFVVIRLEVKKMFKSNHWIRLHAVTAVHGITHRSAAYLKGLIDSPPVRPHHRKPVRRRSMA